MLLLLNLGFIYSQTFMCSPVTVHTKATSWNIEILKFKTIIIEKILKFNIVTNGKMKNAKNIMEMANRREKQSEI